MNNLMRWGNKWVVSLDISKIYIYQLPFDKSEFNNLMFLLKKWLSTENPVF